VWQTLVESWQVLTAVIAAVDIALLIFVIPWILSLKREATSAIAWCLLVILVPLFGVLLFVLFGYQSVNRPLRRKREHRERYRRAADVPPPVEAPPAVAEPEADYEGLGRLATRLDASPPAAGNAVQFFHEGRSAFESVLDAVRAAEHHVHLEFFIFRDDNLGRRLLDLLAQKAKQGVEVRLLTDGIGARRFRPGQAQNLVDAGGKLASFLPVSLLRRRIQVNLRNHRKIVVVDGRVAFTGGLNVGDEYVSDSPRFGFWRDTFLQLEGPAVVPLHRVFVEDWDFATGELLKGGRYFPPTRHAGDAVVQVIASGPDQEHWSIREVFFASMLRARKRLWVTTPYYVPDQAIRNAMGLAALSGVDVRLLIPKFPDHWITYFAGRYYLPELLAAGVKVYQYSRGFVHAKVLLVDGRWASVGTANIDNRSLLLNFEVSCLFHSAKEIARLEAQFQEDVADSVRLEPKVYAARPLAGRLLENVCRLFAPVL
jgi:cardiolipin synthase